LLRYLLRSPGFEVPESLLQTQEVADSQLSERLERLADQISDKEPSSPAMYDTQLSIAPSILHDSNSDKSLAPHSRSFLLLSSRITSLLASLETDIVGHQSQFASVGSVQNAGQHKEPGGLWRSPQNRVGNGLYSLSLIFAASDGVRLRGFLAFSFAANSCFTFSAMASASPL
jgi:multidrug resistance protein MdtO